MTRRPTRRHTIAGAIAGAKYALTSHELAAMRYGRVALVRAKLAQARVALQLALRLEREALRLLEHARAKARRAA